MLSSKNWSYNLPKSDRTWEQVLRKLKPIATKFKGFSMKIIALMVSLEVLSRICVSQQVRFQS